VAFPARLLYDKRISTSSAAQAQLGRKPSGRVQNLYVSAACAHKTLFRIMEAPLWLL
jgi:hypothetical protein